MKALATFRDKLEACVLQRVGGRNGSEYFALCIQFPLLLYIYFSFVSLSSLVGIMLGCHEPSDSLYIEGVLTDHTDFDAYVIWDAGQGGRFPAQCVRGLTFIIAFFIIRFERSLY